MVSSGWAAGAVEGSWSLHLLLLNIIHIYISVSRPDLNGKSLQSLKKITNYTKITIINLNTDIYTKSILEMELILMHIFDKDNKVEFPSLT